MWSSLVPTSSGEEWSRQNTGGSFCADRPRWKLPNLSEQRVLKLGIMRLRTQLCTATDEVVSAQSLPMRQGKSVLRQASFFWRLLANEIELKGACQNDVSAAQSDLCHLSVEQLISVRAQTLDFQTASETHSAHCNFLVSVDNHLLEKFALRCLAGTAWASSPPLSPPSPSEPQTATPTSTASTARQRSELLRWLGVRMVLILGAAEVLAGDSTNASQPGDPPPARWAIRMNPGDWNDWQVAIFDIEQLRLDSLDALLVSGSGGPVAVVADRSVGDGRDRRLHWEVVALDPGVDDIRTEVIKRSGDEGALKRLGVELNAAFRERFVGRTDLGLGQGRGPVEEAESSQDSSPNRAGEAKLATPSGLVAAAVRRLEPADAAPPTTTTTTTKPTLSPGAPLVARQTEGGAVSKPPPLPSASSKASASVSASTVASERDLAADRRKEGGVASKPLVPPASWGASWASTAASERDLEADRSEGVLRALNFDGFVSPEGTGDLTPEDPVDHPDGDAGGSAFFNLISCCGSESRRRC
mmetsp:Transcript_17983/g.49946  ORF Transcript_17983/g.49946 Transcript_17983/m.49946 type:complete len:530 (+) Transcript_17983:70-1659(+)